MSFADSSNTNIPVQGSSLRCQEQGCQEDRKYECKFHKTVVCMLHRGIYHIHCNCEKVSKPAEARVLIDMVEKYLSQVLTHSHVYYTEAKYPGTLEELDRFQRSLNDLRDRYEKALKNDKFMEYTLIVANTLALKREIDSSNMHRNYLEHLGQIKLDEPLQIKLGDSASSGLLTSQRLKRLQEDILRRLTEDNKEELKNMETQYAQKLEEQKKTNEQKLEAKYKDQIEQQNQDLEEQKENIRKAGEENDRLSEEVKTLMTDIKELEESSVVRYPLLEKFYNSVKGTSHNNQVKFTFEVVMNNQKDIDLVKALMNTKLPDIMRVHLETLSPGGCSSTNPPCCNHLTAEII